MPHQTTPASFAQIFSSENFAVYADNSFHHVLFDSLIAPSTITHAERLRPLPSGTLELTVQ